jgi:fermentation-respiration switch protein FrsA (DUF1100 family)
MIATEAAPETRRLRNIRRRRRILYAFVILCGLYFALGAALAWNTMRPKRRTPTHTPALYGLSYRTVTFNSSDGVKLAGWYIPALRRRPLGVVILCHGIDGNRQAMLGSARILHRAGFATVLFDFRARGESGGNNCTLGYRETDDLQAAVRWAGQRTELHGVSIGALGASLGAATVIMCAARTREIRAIVAEAPFAQLDRAVDSHFREIVGPVGPLFSKPTQWAGEIAIGRRARDISPIRDIVGIAPRPVLIIEDAEDGLIPADQTQALYKAAREPKEIWTVPDAGHVGASYVAPEEYARRITKFFTESLNTEHVKTRISDGQPSILRAGD